MPRCKPGWTRKCLLNWRTAWAWPNTCLMRSTSPRSPKARKHSLDGVSELHFTLGAKLGLQRLQQQIEALPSGSYWDNLAKIALGDDLSALQRLVTLEVLSKGQGSATEMLQVWEADNRVELESASRVLSELADAKTTDLAMLSVAMRKLRNLA